MIKDNKILKFTLFMVLVILAIFIYFQYFIMQKYFEQNIQNEQQKINKNFLGLRVIMAKLNMILY